MRQVPGRAVPGVDELEQATGGRVPRAVLRIVVERRLYGDG